jgi:hypothetical protein
VNLIKESGSRNREVFLLGVFLMFAIQKYSRESVVIFTYSIYILVNYLKVPKCEIFHRSDFPDFYIIKSSWVDDLVVKILSYYFNF